MTDVKEKTKVMGDWILKINSWLILLCMHLCAEDWEVGQKTKANQNARKIIIF